MHSAPAVLDPPSVVPAAKQSSQRRALLFFLSREDAYRRPLFSPSEIFCGPDAAPRNEGGRVRALRTKEGAFDIGDVLANVPAEQKPDFIVVKADATGRNLPRNLAGLKVPRVLLVGDTHHLGQPIQKLIRYAQEEPFDLVIFDHTRHHARFFAEAGVRNLHWLPALDYGYEPRLLRPMPSRPLTFVGQAGRFHPYRRWVLEQVQAAGLPLEVLRGRLAETADFYADSQVTLNISLNGDLNLRVFEALAAGGFLLTDALGDDSGLPRLFEAGRHLDTWRTPGELVEKIRHYLAHPDEAARIRQAGQAEMVRRHHPDVKLREFFTLLDGGEPNERYDLRRETWWPRATVAPKPEFFREIVAYEALQEMHRTARRLTLFAAEPTALDHFNNLPRLEIASLAALAAKPEEKKDQPRAVEVLWWDETTPADALLKFPGSRVLTATAAAADRPELAGWGFRPETADSPLFRLAQPLQFLEKAWAANARGTVHDRLPALVEATRDSTEAVVLAYYARLLADHRLQLAALKRAIGLDRGNATALLSHAALTIEQGDSTSVYVLLEEAARNAPLTVEVEKLRRELSTRAEVTAPLGFYLRAIGKVPPPAAAVPRRILVITNLYPPQELGGYGRMMWEFARGLQARGHEVRVLAADQPALAKPATPDEIAMESCVRRTLPLLGGWRGGVPVQITDQAETISRVKAMVAAVEASLREFRPDAVLAGNLDFLSLFPVQVALAAGLPVVHALGNQSPGYAPSNQPSSPRYCLAPSSDWCGTNVREIGYAPPRMETLYPGARLDRFFRFFLPDTARLRFCFAGLVLPYKGPHILVDALARLHQAGVDFTAEIAGDAPDPAFLEKLKGAIRATGMESKVSFTGFLDRTALSALFARSNVLVFPSQVPETFGISQVEAMAAGLVVVSSGTGGAKEIIRHGADGLLFQAERPADLAEKLLSLAQNPGLLARLQRASQARSTSFGVDLSVDKLERLFEELRSVAPEIA
jgi:glycosyltransferase involved in cell wall biosynthesis